MQTKIINSSLLLIIFSSFYFLFQNYVFRKEIEPLNEEYCKKYVANQLKISKRRNKYFKESLISYAELNSQNPFLESVNGDYAKTEKKQYEVIKILSVIDSIYKIDTLGKDWNSHKFKIADAFEKAREKYDTLKWGKHVSYTTFDSLFKKEKLDYNEWTEIISVSNRFKEYVRASTSGGNMDFIYYNLIGIPSKSIVKIGDTISVDWVDYYSKTSLIPETYSRKSNYENYLTLRSYYKIGFGISGGKDNEAILLEEYQIPFSAIEKNKKWRSVFYFRNDKLEQDSVVLERELEF
ncbi:hypothetical protein V9L05_14340 [Bernardetia sp. Wsw4-3y2]|uniref:hypothetical protein n=1 Tax=Bernardetia sp. Wsw4-3y2 TaxID=3127471 RepID=UPI0030CC3A20